MNKILIVDDDPELRESIRELLGEEGYDITTVPDAETALESVSETRFGLILIDLIMPGMGGMNALRLLKEKSPDTCIVVMTAFSTVEYAVESMKQGANDYISKPFKIEELLSVVGRNLEEARFLTCKTFLDMDDTFSSLANSIRRRIIILLSREKNRRFMEITRDLGIDDHTKINFHLKVLKKSGLIEQTRDRSYQLSDAGIKVVECLDFFSKHLNT